MLDLISNLLDNLIFIFERLDWLGVLDLFLVTLIFYGILRLLRDTQAMVLLRGVILLLALISLLTSLEVLPAFSWLMRTTLPALLLAIPVIFAPEIRRALERLGRAGAILDGSSKSRPGRDIQEVITAVVGAATRLSDRRHGGLIVLERYDSLKDYVTTGVQLHSDVTTELILQIFYPNTPLHDGAVLIGGNKILSAASVMPLSASGVLSPTPDRQLGLRHRAALGISEVSDAVAVVISEESGAISVVHSGRMIRRLDGERLDNILRALFQPTQTRKGFSAFLARRFPGLLQLRGEEE